MPTLYTSSLLTPTNCSISVQEVLLKFKSTDILCHYVSKDKMLGLLSKYDKFKLHVIAQNFYCTTFLADTKLNKYSFFRILPTQRDGSRIRSILPEIFLRSFRISFIVSDDIRVKCLSLLVLR